MRDSFVFYRSFAEAMKELPDDQKACLIDLICDYALDGIEPTEGTGAVIGMFKLMKPQIDANNKRYENGKKGGRPVTKDKAEQNQTITKTKPNNNQDKTDTEPNVNVNVNDNVNDNIYSAVIDHLNDVCGTHYRVSTGKTKRLIKARYEEGFTLQDFFTVIDKKASVWKGTDFEKYLRPETLFGTKFEGYLNEKVSSNNPFLDMIGRGDVDDY